MGKVFLYGFVVLFLGMQSQSDRQNPNFTIRGHVGIPRTTGSMMFRTCFTGIYEANLSFNYRLFKNVFAGLGYQNALLKTQKTFVFVRANNGAISYNTQIEQNSGFLKIGTDKFIGNAVYVTYALNAGFMISKYTNVIPDTSLANRPYGLTTFGAPYAQPEFAIHFMTGEEQKMSFSISLSYATLFSMFDPKGPRLNHIDDPAVHIKGNNYFMNWLNVGLGFNVLIGKGKSSVTNSPEPEKETE